jgi:hypothetical protein
VAIGLSQWSHYNTGLIHFDNKISNTAMFWNIPVCSRQKHSPASVMRTRIPYFLTVYYPVIAIAFGTGCQASQIGTTAWLTKELTPGILTRDNRAQVMLLHNVGGVFKQGRCGQSCPNSTRNSNRSRGSKFLRYNITQSYW